MTAYPDDANGAMLTDIAARGVDMSQPIVIDFYIVVTDEASADMVLMTIMEAGYDSEIVYDAGEHDYGSEIDDEEEEFGPSWTVYANVRMIPEYNEIMRIQADLDRLGRPLGGKSDGWGVTLGGYDGWSVMLRGDAGA